MSRGLCNIGGLTESLKRIVMGESNIKPSNQVARTIASGFPVVYVVTWEEERLEGMLVSASETLFGADRPVWVWSAALGFTTGPGCEHKLLDPVDALSFIINEKPEAICLFKDLPVHFKSNHALIRAMRDIYDSFSTRPGSLVVSHPWNICPPELS